MPGEAYATTEEEWDRHRDDMARLYLTENRPLKKVQQIMEAKFGFRATKRMYTTRMKSWGFKKNYHAEEKDFLISQITEALANGQPLSSITLRGQHIRHHRVLRHWIARGSEKEADLSRVPRSWPALNGSILSDIDADDQPKESRTVSVESEPWIASAPSSTHTPTCRTDASPASALGTQSNVATVSCRGPQDGVSTATLSILFPIAKQSPGELIFYATSTYLDSLSETTPSMGGLLTKPPALGLGSDVPLIETTSDANDRFWHDFETAVYLLQIGSFTLGWTTFHATWEKAAETVLTNPMTLLRKLITTLTPAGKLRKFPEILRLVLTFIADLLELKLGRHHPLVHICQHLQLDEQSPRTSEATLYLMRDMLERYLGPFHQETFHTHLGLIVCQRLNRNLAAAEELAQSLIQKSESSPQGAGQLLQALRKMTHVLKDLLRYEEAIALCHRILSHDSNAVSSELLIYTREDLAELYRLQGQLSVESCHLSEALVVSRRWFGHEAAPTLHIQEKLKISLLEQGRESEALL